MAIDNGTTVKTLKFYYDAEGRPFCFDLDGEIYFYITNLQGDIVAIANQYGEGARYEYDAWGKILSISCATGSFEVAAYANPLRYRGYIYDDETGFYYLQSRYYDPAVGRFINSDTFVSTGQGFVGFNLFAYCGNNPICRVDSQGFVWKDATSAESESESRYDSSGGIFGYEHRISTGWEGTDWFLETPLISVGPAMSTTEKSGKKGAIYAFCGRETDMMNWAADQTRFAGIGMDNGNESFELHVETYGIGLQRGFGPINISATINLTGATTIAITASSDLDEDTEMDGGLVISANTGVVSGMVLGIYGLAHGDVSFLQVFLED